MLELIAYIVSQAWNYRRNIFIAVGGTAVFFIGLILLLFRLGVTAHWIWQPVIFLCGVFSLATMALIIYYPVEWIVAGVLRLIRSHSEVSQGTHQEAERKNQLG
jgi:hypothetical protein